MFLFVVRGLWITKKWPSSGCAQRRVTRTSASWNRTYWYFRCREVDGNWNIGIWKMEFQQSGNGISSLSPTILSHMVAIQLKVWLTDQGGWKNPSREFDWWIFGLVQLFCLLWSLIPRYELYVRDLELMMASRLAAVCSAAVWWSHISCDPHTSRCEDLRWGCDRNLRSLMCSFVNEWPNQHSCNEGEASLVACSCWPKPY